MHRFPRHDRLAKACLSAAFLVLLAVAAFASQPVYGATITVTTTDDEENTDGDCSLREAIKAANTDAAVDACTPGNGIDTIALGENTYPGVGTLETITNDLMIAGVGPSLTIISGPINNHGFFVFDSAVEMAALTIQNAGDHGVLVSDDGSLTLTDVTITGSGQSGIASGGTVTLTDSTVSGNGEAGIWTLSATVVSSEVSGNMSGGITDTLRTGGSLVVEDSSISGNSSGGGGAGIYWQGALTITDSTVSQNTAHSNGGGIWIQDGPMTLSQSVVADNTTDNGWGGGIWVNGTATIDESAITGNDVTADTHHGLGGGIGLGGGTLTINESEVSGNSIPTAGRTARGGGIGVNFGVLVMTNSTVSGNSLSLTEPGGATFGYGGGIYNRENHGEFELTYSTIAGNEVDGWSSSEGLGAGVYSGQGQRGAMANTIVANNSGGDCATFQGTIVSAGNNLDSDGSCGLSAAGDISAAIPLLGPLADNGGLTETHALLGGSPAIDAGSLDCPPPTTDQRGEPRAQGNACDIGAFESGFSATPPSSGTPSASATPTPVGQTPTPTPTPTPVGQTPTPTPVGQTPTPTPTPTATPTPTPSPSPTPPGAGNIAFTSDRDGNNEIYVMNEDGTDQTNLTNHSASDEHPDWSPDGSQIAFVSDRDPAGIYVMDADGTDPVWITEGFWPTWSPDGNRIAFVCCSGLWDDIYVIDVSAGASASGKTNLTNSPELDSQPDWSPDGSRIALQSTRVEGPVLFETVSVMNADGSGLTPVFGGFTTDVRAGVPAWSPDGDRIALWGGSLSPIVPFADIYVVSIDGLTATGTSQLMNDDALDGNPTWSPSGDQIAFNTDRSSNNDIFVMNDDGSGMTNLTNNGAEDIDPDWSPLASGGPGLSAGDSNGDGVVDALDALFTLRFVAGMPVEPPDGCALPAAAGLASPQGGSGVCGDVDCDGDADAVDALKILQFVAGFPTNLPPGCPSIGT